MEDIFHDIVANGSETVSIASTEARGIVAAPQTASSALKALSHEKLVVVPSQPKGLPHSCPYCPPALCKGLYVRAYLPYHSQIVFCGDGANDLCSVLCLRERDVAFIRANFKCFMLLKERAVLGDAVAQPKCVIKYWSTQEELAALFAVQLGLR
jgi:hypothetical protein